MKGFFAFLILVFCVQFAAASQVRIKDLVEFDGVRGNDLVGYGLVVGLDGTGDGLRNAPFTEDIMANILERLGVNVTGEQFRPKNVAAVFVTATLPPFARSGSQIDVTISAIGDAKSLLGGTLIMTPLNAADGEIYAVAQGTIIAGGAVAEGDGARVTQGVPTSGTIPSGARVEREQLENISIKLGQEDDPQLPVDSFDRVFLVHVYNEVTEPYAFLYRLWPALAEAGKIIVVETDRPTHANGVPPALLFCEFEAVGYRLREFTEKPDIKGYFARFGRGPERTEPEAIEGCSNG